MKPPWGMKFFVHKKVDFCFHLGHGMFKSRLYGNSKKSTEAVSRCFSSMQTLFSTSLLFESLLRDHRCVFRSGGFLYILPHIWVIATVV